MFGALYYGEAYLGETLFLATLYVLMSTGIQKTQGVKIV